MARSFTGSGGTRLHNLTAPVSAAPLTVVAWMRKTNTSVENLISIATDGSGSNYWRIRTNFGSTVIWQVNNGGGTSGASATGTYTAGVWTHICGVERSSTDRSCFRDGGNEGTNTNARIPSVDMISLGTLAQDSTDSYDGDLAEVAVYDIGLSDGQIADLAGTGGRIPLSPLLVQPQNLVFYAPLIRGVSAAGDGDDFDIIGGRSLTEVGTVTVADHLQILYPRTIPYLPTVPVVVTAQPVGGFHGVLGGGVF